MSLRRTALIMLALVIGLLLIWVLAAGREGDPPAARVMRWPCGDAGRPSYEPLPGLPADTTGFSELFTPVAKVFLSVDELVATDLGSLQEPVVEVTGSLLAGFGDVPKPGVGTLLVAIDDALIDEIDLALKQGNDVWLALQGPGPTGFFSSEFAVDNDARQLLAPSLRVVDPQATAAADRFLSTAVGDGDYARFVFAWSQQFVPGGGEEEGSIPARWEEFLAETYGIGVEQPLPGTREYWEWMPTECRSYFDAPPEVTAGLAQVRVIVLVPKADFPSDSTVCLRTQSGGMGCAAFDAEEAGGRVELDAWATGEALEVQLAVDGGFEQRVTFATIAPEDLLDGVTVDLVEELTGSSYADVVEAR